MCQQLLYLHRSVGLQLFVVGMVVTRSQLALSILEDPGAQVVSDCWVEDLVAGVVRLVVMVELAVKVVPVACLEVMVVWVAQQVCWA
jgi:hypothetical protein